MNELKLSLILAVGMVQISFAQFTDYSGAKNYRTQFGNTQQLFTNISDVSDEGRLFEGKTYLNEDWETYLAVFTFESETVRLPEARFDGLYRELTFIYEGEERTLSQEYVKAFYVKGEDGAPDTYYINPSKYGVSNSSFLSMCEVLVSGEVFLLRERHLKIRDASGKYDPSTGSTELTPQLTDEFRYYLVKANELYPVQPRNRFSKILQTIGGDSFDVKAYAKQYRLKLNKVDNWPQLVEAYNNRDK
ncbi:MAG TPA: hypothetical protein DCE41_14275 [Cytophagales bacterium]|nr:hypothetical protein [Cytophagales bacterium]HAA20443.1 hypothetical protein [Cytophagales bacterium]HAP61309.1 hypothetical protein [Cytophagales bacterium]